MVELIVDGVGSCMYSLFTLGMGVAAAQCVGVYLYNVQSDALCGFLAYIGGFAEFVQVMLILQVSQHLR